MPLGAVNAYPRGMPAWCPRPACLLLAVALSLVGVARAGPEDKPSADARVNKSFNDLYPIAFRVQVNEAIGRGSAWLLRNQGSDGSWRGFAHSQTYPMGCTALAVLTLLKCGTPADHPAIEKAFAYLKPLPLRTVYSVSVLLMALDARYAPARDPFAVEQVDRYGNRNSKDPCANQISPQDKAWMERGVAFLLEHQKADGYWRYPSGGFDTSNTQFALLGLHAATRCGVKVAQRVWLDALRHMLGFQEQVGEPVMYKANEVRGKYRFEWMERAIARGFKYDKRSSVPTSSMTTAGLTCLVICQSRLWRARGFNGAMRTDTRRGIRDAMAWLQTNFAVDHNVGGGQHWTFYNLYGLERAGVLGRFRFLGQHDWYKEGATFLLGRQDPQGHWRIRQRWEGSCFALLFLKRATSRMNAPVITPSGSKEGELAAQETPTHLVPDEDLDPKTATERAIAVARAIRRLEDRDPDVVFQAALRLGTLAHRRAVKPLARVLKLHKDNDARVAAANALGSLRAADALPALIGALTDHDPLVQYAAESALRATTGHKPQTLLRETTSRNARIRLQREWRSWWSENEDSTRKRLKQPKEE